MRTFSFPPQLSEPLYLFRDDRALKAYPDFRAAKMGDPGSAVRLVMDMAQPLAHGLRDRFMPEAIFVAPHAREATGDNAIP